LRIGRTRRSHTMSDAIKGLFGGGKDDDPDDKIKKIGLDPGHAKNFVNRYLDGDPSEGYDKDEAAENFRKVAQNASPEQLQRATRQALAKMNPSQRSDFAKMLEQRQSRGGGNVPIQQAGDRTGGTASGGDVGIDDILGGMMGGAGGGGLGDIFGGLLGGGSGGSGSQGGGLGGMLGGLLGGDDDSDRSRTGAQSGGGGGGSMFGGLGDLLSSPAGKALIGGIAAYGMKEILDGKK
jgi:hypothetical protein